MSRLTNERGWRRLARSVARWTARWERPRLCVLRPGDDFEAWCARHPGGACRLLVSTQLLHELSFEPGLPLHDHAQRVAYARHQFVHYFGGQAPRWRVAAWSGGASALHGLDWPQLQAAAHQHKVRLVSVEPVWAPLLRRVAKYESAGIRAPHAAIAWVEATQLTWLMLEEGTLRAVRKLRLRETTVEALQEALAELTVEARPAVFVAGFGLDHAGPGALAGAKVLGRLDATQPELAGFDAAVPGKAGLPDVDFLGERLRQPPLVWAFLATSLLVLLTAGWSAVAAREAMVRSQARQARLEQRVQANTRAAKSTSAPVYSSSSTNATAELELDRRAGEALAALGWPWEPILADIEELGAAGNLNWLGLDAATASRDIHVEGLASNRQDALRAVDQLGAMPGWREVMLGSLQQSDPGLGGQRFDIHARLQSWELRLPTPHAASAPLTGGA